MGQAQQEIEALMMDRHRIGLGQQPDFQVANTTEIAGVFSLITGTLTAMLASIAGISLIVGGVGIMNIMLVSVTERTREIGIRMAVGARPRDILMQFLVESMVLSLIGGAIGVTLQKVVCKDYRRIQVVHKIPNAVARKVRKHGAIDDGHRAQQ